MLVSIFYVVFLARSLVHKVSYKKRLLSEEKKANFPPKYIVLYKTLFQFLTKMGCGIYYNKYNILYCASMLSLFSHVWPFATLWNVPAKLLCPQDFPGKNTRVGCHFLLHGLFPTQEGSTWISCIAGRFFTTKPPGKPLLLPFSYFPLTQTSQLNFCDQTNSSWRCETVE